MSLENKLLKLGIFGRTDLINEINAIGDIGGDKTKLKNYYKFKTKMIGINYKIVPRELSFIRNYVLDCPDKTERTLRTLWRSLKDGSIEEYTEK